MVEIEINGQVVEAEQGSMIIEAADKAGIHIPRFCYHKKLSIAANCRMCLVEVEKSRKPLPACATPVTEGMKVFTKSTMAIESQKAVMEFLLINHPLDCPICDQGGECELQDVSMGYGGDISQYTEGKRVVKDKPVGPLIATDLTRCIHCTRCVRFGTEIAGLRELGAVGRGEHTEIGTFIEKSIQSELSGNVIDICPVGALTSKPFRFRARTWELRQHPTVSPHDCVGTNVYVHERRGEVMRVVPRDNEAINEVWIADRDRFSYEALQSADRAGHALIKRDDIWREIDWTDAMQATHAQLSAILAQHGPAGIGGLSSPSCTTEEHYLFQRFLRGLGCQNVDHRLKAQDFSDQDARPVMPTYSGKLADIENKDCVILIGSHLKKEQPIINHRVRKAALNGATLIVINPAEFQFNYAITHHVIPDRADILTAVAGVLKALYALLKTPVPGDVQAYLQGVSIMPEHQAIAHVLSQSQNTAMLAGYFVHSHPKAAILRRLLDCMAQSISADSGELSLGANAVGAYVAGALPHRCEAGKPVSSPGLDAQAMFEQPLPCYLFMALEPELDALAIPAIQKALDAAELVICITPYVSSKMRQYADIILPMAAFTETAGSYINIEGENQCFQGVSKPYAEARPAWKILRVLANHFDLDGFDYNTCQEVGAELMSLVAHCPEPKHTPYTINATTPSVGDATCIRLSEVPIYAVDPVVRRATALQCTLDAPAAAVHVNTQMARQLHLETTSVRVSAGGRQAILALEIDDTLPNGVAWIPDNQIETEALGLPFSAISLEQASV